MNVQQLTLLCASALLLAPLWLWLWQLLRRRLKPQSAAAGFDAAARARLRRDSVLYARAPADWRRRAERCARQLLERTRFIGCQELVVTRAMRELIAIQVGVLLAARGLARGATPDAVLLYPGEFVAPMGGMDEHGVMHESEQVLSGEAFGTQRILLSWPDVLAGARAGDGYNVVLHEFAHQLDHALDQELSSPDADHPWHRILNEEFLALQAAVDAGEDTLIDPYGSDDPAEFFAVATEVFMERPEELRNQHPRLYAALRKLYGVDPAEWR
ncbi:MAG: M90 family metallopeptidase [Steroidobacteraceae bacterium]